MNMALESKRYIVKIKACENIILYLLFSLKIVSKLSHSEYDFSVSFNVLICPILLQEQLHNLGAAWAGTSHTASAL